MVNILTNILKPFLSRPNDRIHLLEMSRLLKIPHPTLRLWLNGLCKENILLKEKKGRLTLYYLNFSNPSLFDYLVIAEKKVLMEQIEHSLVLKELKEYIYNEIDAKVLIFGSAAVSIEKANDIDILIIGSYDKKKLKYIGDRLNLDLHVINVSSFAKIKDSLKKEIISKHIIIKNSEELVRWLFW